MTVNSKTNTPTSTSLQNNVRVRWNILPQTLQGPRVQARASASQTHVGFVGSQPSNLPKKFRQQFTPICVLGNQIPTSLTLPQGPGNLDRIDFGASTTMLLPRSTPPRFQPRNASASSQRPGNSFSASCCRRLHHSPFPLLGYPLTSDAYAH